jgi:DNA-binding CsgD family transcriptional regulator
MLGLFRRKSGRSFTQADVDLLSELIPFIRQAIGISERITRARIENNRALDTLDKIPLGILLVTRDARVVQANATAQAVADLDDGMVFSHDRLRLHSKPEERLLHEAVRSAAMPSIDGQDRPTTPISISRPSGKPALSAIVTPLGSNAFNAPFHTAGEPCAAIFLSIPERPLEAPADLLRRLFALTAMQASVCELLVSGATLQQTADQLGITHETARVHLKTIFLNVGVHKQSELIAKILSTPVWVARQSIPGGGVTAQVPDRRSVI